MSMASPDGRSDRGRRPCVIVTGANSGIGLATAIRAAAHGYDTVATVRSAEKAEVVVEHAEREGVSLDIEIIDITDADACEALIDRRRPWGLVNNAGFAAVGAVEDVDDDEARLALEVMVVAPIRLARLALPHMRARGGGRIVNISSVYGFTATALSGWYQGAKHALEGLSDALRIEVAGDKIAVVLVEPGGFRTGIWAEQEAELERRGTSRYAASYRRSLDLARRYDMLMGEPDEVAATIVAALADGSPRARYLVGRDAWAIAVFDRFTVTPVKDRVQRFFLGL
jgi:NAD(P)-dependent dehydrogenase (short-subunit alcohol dehydrogenase family)